MYNQVSNSRKIKIVTAAIIRKQNKFLICQRTEDDECGLLWEFPGGKQVRGETLGQCIVREIKEELELDIKVEDVFTTSVYHFSGYEVHFTVYDAIIKSGIIKLNVHNDAKWITRDELDDYQFMPPDIVFVDRLKAKL